MGNRLSGLALFLAILAAAFIYIAPLNATGVCGTGPGNILTASPCPEILTNSLIDVPQLTAAQSFIVSNGIPPYSFNEIITAPASSGLANIGGGNPETSNPGTVPAALDTWVATNAYPSNIEAESCVSNPGAGYIYCMAGYGFNGISDNYVYNAFAAPVNNYGANGIGAWVPSANAFMTNTIGTGCIMPSNTIYCVGGYNPYGLTLSYAGHSAYANIVTFATVSGNVISSWASTNSYPLFIANTSCGAASGIIYCFGGTTTNTLDGNAIGIPTNAVYYANILPNSGGIGAWTQANSLAWSGATHCDQAPTGGMFHCIGPNGAYAEGTPGPTGISWSSISGSSGAFGGSYKGGTSCVAFQSNGVGIYCIGGYASAPSVPLSMANYTFVNPQNGGAGSFFDTVPYPVATENMSCVFPGAIVCIGGYNGMVSNSVYYAIPSNVNMFYTSSPVNDLHLNILQNAAEGYPFGTTVPPNTIAGVWTFNALIYDSTGANTLSVSNTLTINLQPAVTISQPSNPVIGVGQSTSLTVNVIVAGGYPCAGTDLFDVNILKPGYISVNGITSTAQCTPTSLLFTPSVSGAYTLNAVANDISTSSPYIFNSPFSVNVNVNNGLAFGIAQFPQGQGPILQQGKAFTGNIMPIGGTPGPAPNSYTYNWFAGSVLGGYDLMQFSLVPPFQMPQPQSPSSRTPPNPMFEYQNPGNTLTVTPYAWNGIAFNAMSTGNVLAVAGGNESVLPAFLPNLFVVSSNHTGMFTINTVGAQYQPGAGGVQNSVIYNLDTYSLMQSNTLNVATVLTSNSPQIQNAIARKLVDPEVTITNLGISANYVSAYTPPFIVAVAGWGGGLNGSKVRSFLIYGINALPASSNTALMQGPSSLPTFLAYNITGVWIYGLTPPAPGVRISIYDSINANGVLPSQDPSNNIQLAQYTYNGPTLLYNVPNGNFLGEVPANTPIAPNNLVTYSGENGIPVNLILTTNTLLVPGSAIPTNSVTYFTYNMPEIANAQSNVPNTFMLINLTNSTRLGQFPAYTFVRSFTSSNTNINNMNYINSAGNGIVEMAANVTDRGSAIGPITPMAISYYMATNVIAYNSVSEDTTNSFTFNSVTASAGPNLVKVSVKDAGTPQETANGIFSSVFFPAISPATVSITNTTVDVGKTTFLTLFFSGGQPPYTGYWSLLPPSASTTINNTFTLTLPINEITLLVNVTSANTLILTPTLGANTTIGGGRNNSLVLYITHSSTYGDNRAFLKLPSFGSRAPASLLLATGLTNDTVYGLWGANTVVGSTDPGTQFSIPNPSPPAPSTTTIYYGTGGSSGMATGGGGGVQKPSISTIPNGYIVNGIAQLNTFSITLCGEAFTVTDNYISPNATGISVNNALKVLTLGNPVQIGASGQGSCYAMLNSIQYTPILHNASVSFYLSTNALRIINVTGPSFNGLIPYISSNSPLDINFENGNALILVYTASNVPFTSNVSLANDTASTPNLTGYKKLLSFGVNVSSPSASLNITVHYPCSAPSPTISVYKLLNGAWAAITSTANASACTVSFSLAPGDPIIGVFQALPPKTTTVPVSTAQTTSQAAAPPAQAKPPAATSTVIAVIAVAIILLMIAAYYLSRKGKRRRGPLARHGSRNPRNG